VDLVHGLGHPLKDVACILRGQLEASDDGVDLVHDLGLLLEDVTCL